MKKTGEEPLLSGGNGVVNESAEKTVSSRPLAREPKEGERETPTDIADQLYRDSERRIEEAWQLDR